LKATPDCASLHPGYGLCREADVSEVVASHLADGSGFTQEPASQRAVEYLLPP
jgi:hypothetical protein